jgi:hypothetical protein
MKINRTPRRREQKGETQMEFQDRRVAYAKKRLTFAEAEYRRFAKRRTGFFDGEESRRLCVQLHSARTYLARCRHERLVAFAYEKNYLPLFLT